MPGPGEVLSIVSGSWERNKEEEEEKYLEPSIATVKWNIMGQTKRDL